MSLLSPVSLEQTIPEVGRDGVAPQVTPGLSVTSRDAYVPIPAQRFHENCQSVFFLISQGQQTPPFHPSVGGRQPFLGLYAWIHQIKPLGPLQTGVFSWGNHRGRQLLQGQHGVCFLHFPNRSPSAASLMLVCPSPWGDSHNFISRSRDKVPGLHITASLHGRKFSMGTTDKTHKDRQGHCSLGLRLRVLGGIKDSVHFDSQPTPFYGATLIFKGLLLLCRTEGQ